MLKVFMDISKTRPEDFKKATETVFHEAGEASGLELLVMPQQVLVGERK